MCFDCHLRYAYRISRQFGREEEIEEESEREASLFESDSTQIGNSVLHLWDLRVSSSRILMCIACSYYYQMITQYAVLVH